MFGLTHRNPFNFTLLVFHSASNDLKEVKDEYVLLAQLFKARCIVFDYPGYGLNKNSDDTPLETMCDAILKNIQKKGYREDRIIIVGYEYGCGAAIQYADMMAQRKKEALSTETAGLILFYPRDDVEFGGIEFEHFYNPTQNIIYTNVMMFVSKRDKEFHCLKEIKKMRRNDEKYRERITVCESKFKRLKPSSLSRSKLIKITEDTYPWFQMLNTQINKVKMSHVNIMMAITTTLKMTKKIPPLPTHNMFYINEFLKNINMDMLIPLFEEKMIYSVVFALLNPLDDIVFTEEDKDDLKTYNKAIKPYKPIITRGWTTLCRDVLSNNRSRIVSATNIMNKQARQQSRVINADDGIELEEEPTRNVIERKAFEVPSWARGVECDFSSFTYQPVNFSDYFAFKDSLHNKRVNQNQ